MGSLAVIGWPHFLEDGGGVPELPEVESVRRLLVGAVLNRAILEVHCGAQQLRRALDPDRLRTELVGARFAAVDREAKYLLMRLEGRDGAVLVHLGMTGRLLVVERERPTQPHTHIVVGLEGGVDLRYVDVRRFGFFCWSDTPAAEPSLLKLGLDPLADGFEDRFVLQARSRGVSIKSLLMDQGVIGGVGNIYASEALWRSRVDPRRRAGQLSARRLKSLAEAVRAVLLAAIEGGGSTIKDFVLPDGDSGGFVKLLKVYGHEGEPCVRCGELLKKIRQAGRSTFYCPKCQR